MAAPTVALTVVLLAALLMVNATTSPSLSSISKIKHINYKELQKPQPRAIDVMPHIQMSPAEIVYPHQTVLHRCDSLACCAQQQNLRFSQCIPTVQNVTLYFKVFKLIGKRMESRILIQDFQNHTRCECKSKSESLYKIVIV